MKFKAVSAILAVLVIAGMGIGCGPTPEQRAAEERQRAAAEHQQQMADHAAACARLSQEYDTVNDICLTDEIKKARAEASVRAEAFRPSSTHEVLLQIENEYPGAARSRDHAYGATIWMDKDDKGKWTIVEHANITCWGNRDDCDELSTLFSDPHSAQYNATLYPAGQDRPTILGAYSEPVLKFSNRHGLVTFYVGNVHGIDTGQF